ncbi:unnamed protein product [Closterium sp. NIES-64]|nr:unnamed protein product [Closterium sp. NIES-64]
MHYVVISMLPFPSLRFTVSLSPIRHCVRNWTWAVNGENSQGAQGEGQASSVCLGEYLLSVDEDRHVLMWLVRGEGIEMLSSHALSTLSLAPPSCRPCWQVGTFKGHRAKSEGRKETLTRLKHPLPCPSLPLVLTGGVCSGASRAVSAARGVQSTGVIHPDTYLNKLLFASEDGRMQLWNVNSRKLLYEFKGWGVGITALVGSPALDTVAVGCSDGKCWTVEVAAPVGSPALDTVAVGCSDGKCGGGDGKVHVHNIRLDRPVVDFTHAAAGAVTSLAFNSVGIAALVGSPALDTVAVGCSDGKVHVHNIRLDKPAVDFTTLLPALWSASSSGGRHGRSYQLWDLTNRRLHSIIPDAHDGRPPLSIHLTKRHLHSIIPDTHDGRVAALSFLVNEPLLLSAGFESTQKQASLFCSLLGQTTASRYYRNGRHILITFLPSHPITLHPTPPSHLTRSHPILPHRTASHPTPGASKCTSLQVREGGGRKEPSGDTPLQEEKLKLSKVVCIDAGAGEGLGERGDLHEGNPAAFVWELRNFVIGKLRLVPPGIEPSPATSARHRVAYQWRKKRAMHPLSLPPPCPTHQVCAASMCGNFALVGTSSGHLHLFHLQSARHRVAYQSEKMQYSPAHGGMVTGAAIDALNRHSISCGRDGRVKSPAHGGMVTGAAVDALNGHSINGHSISCGRDGHVKVRAETVGFKGSESTGRQHRVAYQSEKMQYSPMHGGMVWYLKSGRLRFDVNVGSPIVKFEVPSRQQPSSNRLREFHDLHLRRRGWPAVRRFPGHEDRITAVEVSPDGRWLLTSAMDLTVRTWHVVSGRPLDAFQVPTAVVGLSMSPLRTFLPPFTSTAGESTSAVAGLSTSDLPATIHLNRRGIYLWANKAMANKAMYSGIDDSDLLPVPPSLPAATATDGTGTNSSVPAVQMPILIGPNEGAEGEEEDEEGRRVGGRGVGTGDVAVIAGEGGGGEREPLLLLLLARPNLPARLVSAEPTGSTAAAADGVAGASGGSSGGALPGWGSEGDAEMEEGEEEEERRGGMHCTPQEGGLEDSEMDTELMRAIRRGAQSESADCHKPLRSCRRQAVDLELRAIEIVDDSPSPADLHRVALFMSFLEGKLRGSCDFELLQAVTHRFLAIHGSTGQQSPHSPSCAPSCLPLKEAQASSWQRLDELFQSIRCVVDFIASS